MLLPLLWLLARQKKEMDERKREAKREAGKSSL
jgi:hypothetical protein